MQLDELPHQLGVLVVDQGAPIPAVSVASAEAPFAGIHGEGVHLVPLHLLRLPAVPRLRQLQLVLLPADLPQHALPTCDVLSCLLHQVAHSANHQLSVLPLLDLCEVVRQL